MLKKHYLSLSILTLLELLINGCVTVPAVDVCSVAGTLSAGGVCANTHTGETYDMDFDQYVAFLEPNETRGGALCQSAEDWNKLKTTLEKACRELGPRCSYEVKQAIKILRTRPSR